MRILLMNDDFPPSGQGGGATVVAQLAHGYRNAGHAVHVLTTHQEGGGHRTEEWNGIPVTRLGLAYRTSLRPYLSLWNPGAAKAISAFLQGQGRFDVAHAHNVHSYLTYASLGIVRRNVPRLVVTFHDVMSVSYGRLATDRYLNRHDARLSFRDHVRQAGITVNPLRNLLIRRSLRHASARIAVSNALRDVLECNGVRVDAVIHNGIDVTAVQPSREDMATLAERWGTAGKPVIFFGGRLSHDKGLRELLAAYRTIRNDVPAARILVVGDAEKARRLTADAGDLRGALVLTGWLERAQLLAALALSDLCVTSSVCFDSFPTINLEAMALGKPVIATCFGGSREVVDDGTTGYIVDPRETDAFAHRLKTLLSDSDRRQRMGAAGRARIASDCTLRRQIELYERVLYCREQ